MYSNDGVVWTLATDSIYDATFTNTNAAFTALYAPSLQRNQNVIMMFTGLEAGHQFELEFVRHFEGQVKDEF